MGPAQNHRLGSVQKYLRPQTRPAKPTSATKSAHSDILQRKKHPAVSIITRSACGSPMAMIGNDHDGAPRPSMAQLRFIASKLSCSDLIPQVLSPNAVPTFERTSTLAGLLPLAMAVLLALRARAK
jgi:hypothetical protein